MGRRYILTVMIITAHGEGSFRLQAGDVTVLVDPSHARSFKGSRAIISTVRPARVDPPVPQSDPNTRAPFWIDHQGEYDLGGLSLRGVTAEWDRDDEHTSYRIEFDGIVVGLLGPLAREPDKKVLELIAGVDILITPAGGKPLLPVTAAVKLARQAEPSAIIPSVGDFTSFTKEVGGETETTDRFTVRAKDLDPKAMRVVLLTS
jgi:L-ascorbate metabolism protein UlaG (beta-lactamase superfamily)